MDSMDFSQKMYQDFIEESVNYSHRYHSPNPALSAILEINPMLVDAEVLSKLSLHLSPFLKELEARETIDVSSTEQDFVNYWDYYLSWQIQQYWFEIEKKDIWLLQCGLLNICKQYHVIFLHNRWLIDTKEHLLSPDEDVEAFRILKEDDYDYYMKIDMVLPFGMEKMVDMIRWDTEIFKVLLDSEIKGLLVLYKWKRDLVAKRIIYGQPESGIKPFIENVGVYDVSTYIDRWTIVAYKVLQENKEYYMFDQAEIDLGKIN